MIELNLAMQYKMAGQQKTADLPEIKYDGEN